METPNAAQAEVWNARPGQNWAIHQEDLDILHSGVLDLLIESAAPGTGEAVLDLGCGAGASTFALAGAVGRDGSVLGLDISHPLVERAEVRKTALGLANVTFTVADAQIHPFEPARFDLAVSRFGLMFFSDPLAAFGNIRSALRPGGRIVFAAWTGPEQNPWFSLPQRVAVERLGPVAPGAPDAPGPMAFRDRERVVGILQAAGFSRCEGVEHKIDLHHPGGLEAVMNIVSHVGPIARMMRDMGGTEEDGAAILGRIASEMRNFEAADGIRIPAGVNLFSARVP